MRRGVTLLEMLICATITAMLAGILVVYFITTMRVWRRCSSFAQAFPPAYAVVTRLNRELKNAYYIAVATDQHSITFRLPKTDTTGLAVTPLALGREISYYRSDTSGQTNKTGTILWRKELNAVTNKTTKVGLATNVQALTFTCNATQSGRVFAVYSSAVTTLGQEQRTKYTSQFAVTTAIRNPTGP